MTALQAAYGSVLIDDQGRILLRKPKDEFDGYVRTFAKGRQEPGDTPEQTALREVLEESGYRAQIVGRIPGSYIVVPPMTEFFSCEPQAFTWETEAIRWVPLDDAPGFILKTRNKTGRERDLAALEAIVTCFPEIMPRP